MMSGDYGTRQHQESMEQVVQGKVIIAPYLRNINDPDGHYAHYNEAV